MQSKITVGQNTSYLLYTDVVFAVCQFTSNRPHISDQVSITAFCSGMRRSLSLHLRPAACCWRLQRRGYKIAPVSLDWITDWRETDSEATEPGGVNREAADQMRLLPYRIVMTNRGLGEPAHWLHWNTSSSAVFILLCLVTELLTRRW